MGEDKRYTKEEIDEIMKNSYEGEVDSNHRIKETIYVDVDENVYHFKELLPTKEYQESIIRDRIVELRIKLIEGTITADEREELKLLIG